jgi:ribosomal protein S18 acetylase RimI-like enzyme
MGGRTIPDPQELLEVPESGEVSLDQVRAQVEAGEWFVHRKDGEIAGALRLLWSDPQFWGDRPDDAAYVHGLMIDRRYARQGLGERLLEWAAHRARQEARRFLRLDCVETNRRLQRYYFERGFRRVGRLDAEGPWYAAVLLEKALG